MDTNIKVPQTRFYFDGREVDMLNDEDNIATIRYLDEGILAEPFQVPISSIEFDCGEGYE